MLHKHEEMCAVKLGIDHFNNSVSLLYTYYNVLAPSSPPIVSIRFYYRCLSWLFIKFWHWVNLQIVRLSLDAFVTDLRHANCKSRGIIDRFAIPVIKINQRWCLKISFGMNYCVWNLGSRLGHCLKVLILILYRTHCALFRSPIFIYFLLYVCFLYDFIINV